MGLRFVMVTTFYPPYNFGGDGTYVRRLAHALLRRGHQVDVIHDADAYRVLSGKEPEPVVEPPGLTVHRLESRLRTLSLLATQQAGHPVVHGHRIKRLLDEGDYDVIHFHNVSLVGGPGVLAYGDAIKLYTAHEHWLVCPSHILWRHGREVCTGRECLTCVLKHRRPPQLWRQSNLLERMTEHVDTFCALSQFSADKHAEFGFPAPMTVVPSFLPDTPPLEGPVRRVHETPYFLFVGRLEKIKGLQDVIPHFGDDAPAELWIVGDGDYAPELKRLAEGKRKVRFLGQRPPESIPPLYRDALALVTPSVCYEVFPLVVLEAFKEATPIIARRLGPYPEIVDQTGGGLLFHDPASLQRALTAVAGDAALRARLGAAALAGFQARWTEQVSLGRYFQLIREAAEKKGRRRVLDALASAAHHDGPRAEAG
ncbi:MAG: glycosyltransferase family 4 protein [Deltaproteobacteria bacterium]|nr:glycosyltransferase family 4 protein [Deltaproteobacteria bacterium]